MSEEKDFKKLTGEWVHKSKLSELEEQAQALYKAAHLGFYRIGKLTNGYVTNEIQRNLAIEDYHKLNQAIEAYEAWKRAQS